MTIWWDTRTVYIDWAARDREIHRQLNEGVINIDKINAAARITVR